MEDSYLQGGTIPKCQFNVIFIDNCCLFTSFRCTWHSEVSALTS